jgi:hypothetical protein
MTTLGEKRVRASFNPSNQSAVDQIKQKTAELIDICDRLPGPKDTDSEEGRAAYGEFRRLMALAQTSYEEAAMWAVKAATV